MNYIGEKFLDKLYSNLYISKEVTHTKKNSDNRYEAIKKYLDRLNRIHINADTESKKRLLEKLYFDKYIIKKEDISNKFDKDDIIDNQKKSLKMWIDYLSDTTTSYPLWAKYWAFQGMLKMGSYDEAKEIYLKRNKKTVSPFISANPEIIAKSIETIIKLVNSEEITNELEEEITKNDSFSKIYTLYEKKYKKNITINENDDGIWIKYNQGNHEDALKLCKSLENKNTGWCSASESYAVKQVCGPYNDTQNGGDFYVYYTKDKNEEYTNPRIAIRLIDKYEIGEVRGILDGQNLEEEMIPILENKLNEMTFIKKEDIDKNIKIIKDLKELNEMDKKTEKGIKLSDIEITYLYTKKYGFGWSIDPKAIKLKNKRNKKEDIQSITDDNLLIYIIRNILQLAQYIDFDKKSDVLLEIIKENANVLSYIDKKYLTNREFLLDAVKLNGNVYYFIKDELRKDTEIITESINKESKVIEHVPSHLRNKKLMLKVIKQNGYLYQYVPSYLEDDKDIILEAVRENGNALGLMSDTIKDNREIVLEAINQNPYSLRHASIRMKSDKEVVMAAIKKEGITLKYALDELRIDREVVLTAVRQNGSALACVPTELKNDKEIVITAIKQDPFALLFASENLKQNEKIVSIAAHINKYSLKYASKKLQNKFKSIS